MYKGKFNQKGKTTDIEQLLAERAAAAEKEAKEAKKQAAMAAERDPDVISPRTAKASSGRDLPPKTVPAKPVSQKAPAAPGKPVSGKTASVPPRSPKTPAAPGAQPAAPRRPAAPAPQKKKKGPRTGGVIFYTLYFLFILVFFVSTYFGMNWLYGWLEDFEASQPTAKAEQVFNQLFTNPDWSALYEASGAQDSPYEGKEEFVSYMQQKVDPTQLTYLETSAGLSGDQKYQVRMGDETIATFTLVDKNNVGDTTLENLGEIPDWELGTVELQFTREGTYRIELLNGHTAYVNGVALDESFTIQEATTKAEEYLPEGLSGVVMCTQEITGLMTTPTVTINDASGNAMEVTYDETTRTFTERTESNTMSDDEKTVALEAARTNCLYMIERADRGDVAKYFDNSSKAYSDIVNSGDLWMQGNSGYEFTNESVTNYARYGDSMFSVRVSIDLNVTRTDGTIKTFEYDRTLFFEKKDSGKWMVVTATNVDVSLPVGRVRLTFMNGDTMLVSDFYDTASEQVVTPVITSVPEGKVFSGWVRQDVDDSGRTTLTLVFQPDDSGIVNIPEGTTLTPMTLYALFEDADSATVAQQSASSTEATAASAETTAATEGA